MNQYPSQQNPPSYQEVFGQGSNQMGGESDMHESDRTLQITFEHKSYFKTDSKVYLWIMSLFYNQLYFTWSGSANIGEMTTAQPAFPNSYPVLPSAPPHDIPQQNYGSISEVIVSQPSANIIIVGACPICRIGKF